MSQPTLSVLMPVFNTARFLRAAIESVLAQTSLPDELIILDNHSTDETHDIARSFADRSFVRVIRNDRNIGAVPNWIKVANLSDSDFLMVLPGDDLLLPDCVGRWRQTYAANPDIGLFISGHELIDKEGRHIRVTPRIAPVPTGRVAGSVLIDWMLAYGQPNIVAGTFIRRLDYLAVGGFDLRLQGAIDYDLFLRLLGSGPAFVDQSCNAICRVHSGQWSTDVFLRDNSDADVLFEKIDEFSFLTVDQRRTFVECLCDYSRQYFTRPLRDPSASVDSIQQERRRIQSRLRRWRNSNKSYAGSVRFWPRRFRPWLAWLVGSTAIGIGIMHWFLATRTQGNRRRLAG